MNAARQQQAELPLKLLGAVPEVLRVLGHPQRLKIIEVLDLDGPAPVHQVILRLGLPQATVSQHLNLMRRAGLITGERRGKEIWYSIADPKALTILECIRAKGATS